MNKLQELIEKIEKDTARGETQEKLLQMLREKEAELGTDLPEEDLDLALEQVFSEYLMYALAGNLSAEDSEGEDLWGEDMEENMRVIRSAFDEMELLYRDYVHQENVRAFELTVTGDGKTLQMKVYLEAFPKVCRIDAIYPFQLDRAFAYPLCEKLVTENYSRRFTTLQYDERDGELSCRYTFPITHGLHRDDFQTMFLAVAASADDSYDMVRQYATGRFRRKTREEITCRAQELIIELNQ